MIDIINPWLEVRRLRKNNKILTALVEDLKAKNESLAATNAEVQMFRDADRRAHQILINALPEVLSEKDILQLAKARDILNTIDRFKNITPT